MAVVDPYCSHLASPNPWTLALSIFLVAGILVSYLPQHVKIIQNGTSAGLSPWWVLLGSVSSISALGNILVLPTSQHDMACCREISGAACGAALLGVVQIGVQWTCFMAIMVLFLAFFPRTGAPTASDSADDHVTSPASVAPGTTTTAPPVLRKRDAVIVAAATLTTLLAVGIASVVILARFPHLLLAWANVLGISSSALACVQYLPQIWTTWRTQQVLSLSVLTMLIQVPGAFLFAFSLWLRTGAQGWSSWLVYCVTGVFQGVLLVMAVRFWMREREGGVRAEDVNEHVGRVGDAGAETEPLLSGRSGGSARKDINGRSAKNHLGMLYNATPPDRSSVVSDTPES